MIKHNDKAQSKQFLYWVKGSLCLGAIALAVVGLFLFSTAWATRNSGDWWLGSRDPLLGISSRAMLVAGGLLHLVAAAYLFAARDLFFRSLVVLCIGLNHLLYYAGVHLVEPSALSNAEHFIAWRLRLQPEVLDARWKILQLALITGSVVFLVLIWRRSKQLTQEAWFRQWQKTRTQPAKAMPALLKKPRPSGDHVKNVCSKCGQKIAFPLSRLGETITCPRCTANITLREPPART